MVIEEVFQHWSQTLCTTAIHNYKMLVSVVRILSAILLKEKQTLLITLTDKSLKPLLLILKFSKKKKGKNSFLIAIGLLHNQHNHCGKLERLSSEFPKQIYWSKRTGSCKKSKLESHTTITTLAKKKSENVKSCAISRFLSQTSCKPYFTRQKFRTGN